MIARSETIFKWLLYAAVTMLFLLVQGLILQQVRILGAMPFVYPLLAAVVAMFEDALGGTIYALALGVLCDLTLPTPIPCFYTLILPAAALCAALIARSLLPVGFVCAVAVSVLAFFWTDLFHCLLLAAGGKAAWSAGGLLFLQETAASLPVLLPLYWLLRKVWTHCHRYD